MSLKINKNFNKLPKNYLFYEIDKKVAVFKEKFPTKPLINLGIGDVTLPVCPLVATAMQNACEELTKEKTFRGYSPYGGYPFLKNAVCSYYSSLKIDVDSDEIFINDGAKSDLAEFTKTLDKPDVFVPDPVYPVYMDGNILAGNNVYLLPTSAENDFMPKVSENLKPGVYYLCSPSNPAGGTFNKTALKEWVDFANDTRSLIIYDTAYADYITDDSPRSVYEIDGALRCAVEISSFSKSAGFTGIRCGYTVVPKQNFLHLNGYFSRLKSTTTNGVSYITQRGAEAVLTEVGRSYSKECVKTYLNNCKEITDFLTNKGIFYTGGKNSPYVFIKCPNNYSSWQFFDYLLYEGGLIVTPGEGFGERGKGFIRVTGFGKNADVKRAVQVLKNSV